MKKILNFAAVAALALGAVSCTKDDNIGAGGGADVADGKKMTFTLPLPQKGITYAIADDDEMYVNPDAIRIFMFDNGSEELEAIFDSSIIDSEMNSGVLSATIERQDSWQGDKLFYFAVNRPTADNLPKALPAEGEPAIMKSDFLETLTIPFPTSAATRPSHLMTGVSEVVTDIANAPSVIPGDISLYRSVARFDIYNDVTINSVEIKKIYVEKANRQGYVFGYLNRPNVAPDPVVGNLEDLDVAASGEDGLQDEEGLFYLQPTVIKADGTGTVIKLLGSVGNKEKLFNLKAVNTDGAPVDLVIEANKRYLISAFDETGMTFTLTVMDWDEADDEVIGKPSKGDVGMIPGSTVLTDGTTTVDAAYTFAVASAGANFSFDVMSSTAKGVDVSLTTIEENGFVAYGDDKVNVTTSTESNITYAAPYYKTTVHVTMDGADIVESDNFMSVVRLTDKGTRKVTRFKVFHAAEGDIAPEDMIYPGTTLKAIKMTDGTTTAYFAPVNVGATEIGTSSNLSHIGYHFQWGRNVPFDWTNFKTIQGPLTAEEAAKTNYYIVSLNNWLSKHDHSLWSGEKAQGPCPKGWRTFSQAEAEILLNTTFVHDPFTDAYSWEGENGETLYMNSKIRIGTSGGITTTYARYWTHTIGTNNPQTFRVYDGQATVTSSNMYKAIGYHVRCVLNIIEE